MDRKLSKLNSSEKCLHLGAFPLFLRSLNLGERLTIWGKKKTKRKEQHAQEGTHHASSLASNGYHVPTQVAAALLIIIFMKSSTTMRSRTLCPSSTAQQSWLMM